MTIAQNYRVAMPLGRNRRAELHTVACGHANRFAHVLPAREYGRVTRLARTCPCLPWNMDAQMPVLAQETADLHHAFEARVELHRTAVSA